MRPQWQRNDFVLSDWTSSSSARTAAVQYHALLVVVQGRSATAATLAGSSEHRGDCSLELDDSHMRREGGDIGGDGHVRVFHLCVEDGQHRLAPLELLAR